MNSQFLPVYLIYQCIDLTIPSDSHSARDSNGSRQPERETFERSQQRSRQADAEPETAEPAQPPRRRTGTILGPLTKPRPDNVPLQGPQRPKLRPVVFPHVDDGAGHRPAQRTMHRVNREMDTTGPANMTTMVSPGRQAAVPPHADRLSNPPTLQMQRGLLGPYKPQDASAYGPSTNSNPSPTKTFTGSSWWPAAGGSQKPGKKALVDSLIVRLKVPSIRGNCTCTIPWP